MEFFFSIFNWITVYDTTGQYTTDDICDQDWDGLMLNIFGSDDDGGESDDGDVKN